MELWEAFRRLGDKEIIDGHVEGPGMRAAMTRELLTDLGLAIQEELEAVKREIAYGMTRHLEEVIQQAVTEGVKIGVREGIKQGIKEILAELIKEAKKEENSETGKKANDVKNERKKN